MSNIGYMKFDTYKNICDAVREKTKEDNLYLASELPEKIRNIKSGGFDFISESRDYNFTNDNPHPTVNITTQNNEAYFIYDNRDRKAWYSIRFYLLDTKSTFTAATGHLDNNGGYVEDEIIGTFGNGTTPTEYFNLDYDYTVLKITGGISYWMLWFSGSLDGVSISTSMKLYQPMIECIADLPTFVGYNTAATSNSFQLPWKIKRMTLKNAKPKYLNALFNGCVHLEQFNIVDCDFSQLISMFAMFYNCQSLKTYDFTDWNIGDTLTSISNMFYSCSSLETVNFNGINSHNIHDVDSLFIHCQSLKNVDLRPLDLSKARNINNLFNGCQNLKSIDLSEITFGKISSAINTFTACYSLEKLKLPELDFTNCTSVANIFSNCKSLNFDDDLLSKIQDWNITNKCTSIAAVFNYCYSLQNIDISGWDLSNVGTALGAFSNCYGLLDIKLPQCNIKSSFNSMFNSCYSLRNIDLSGLNPISSLDCGSMFSNCWSLKTVKLPIGLQPTTMVNMFYYCYSLENIENFNTVDTSVCATMSNMFNNTRIKQIDLSNLVISDKCTTLEGMFRDCPNLEEIVFNPDLPHDASKITSVAYLCYGITNLKRFECKIAMPNITTARFFGEGCRRLKYIDTLFSLDKIPTYPPTYANSTLLEYANYSSQPTIAYNLSTAPNLSREYLLDVINKLPNLSAAKTLTLGQHRLKLTNAELKIATDKKWTIA